MPTPVTQRHHVTSQGNSKVDIIHVLLVLQTHSARVRGNITTSTGALEGCRSQVTYSGVNFLHEVCVCEAVKMKHGLHQIPWHIEDVRNTGHKLRKAPGSNWSKTKGKEREERGEGTPTKDNRCGGSVLSKYIRYCHQEPQISNTEVPGWCLSCFAPMGPCYPLVTPLSKGHVYSDYWKFIAS